ncbi:MAG: hypothetical protein H7328_07710 [Bdellovibrio sp.]|nr:hypothetical protein [Bdellovibrio sp.]
MAVNKAKTDAKEKKAAKPKPVTGFEPLKFKDHTITQKRSGRFAVVTAKGVTVNGTDKEKLLIDAKVMKGSFKKETAPTETPAT